MKKQNIEDIFSSMEDFSSVPPPELWGQIEEKLDKPKKKKRAILWWSAAACLLLGLTLNSVFHLSSTSGIKNINSGSQDNNNVVLDQKKNDLDKDKTNTTEENNKTIKSTGDAIVSSEKEQINSSLKNQKQEVQTVHTNSKGKTHNTILESDLKTQKANTNQVAEEETFVSAKENTVNSSSKNKTLNHNKENTNKAVTEQNFVPAQENSFNGSSKNKTLNNKKANQAVAEGTFTPATGNMFNASSKYQIASGKKGATNQTIAEQKVIFGKESKFNSTSKNKVSNSIFDDKLTAKNSSNIAFNSSNSAVKGNPNMISENKTKQRNESITPEKAVANTQKENSKFIDILSKQDSIQLAVLQNLEKGIITPEEKTEKDKKPKEKAEKWAVALFAGVANSENYKNEKTLGNTNDSKQSSTYGAKAKYNINKKWAVASGFKINELGQSVANISYVSAKNNAFFTPSDNYAIGSSAAPQIASSSDYVIVSNNTKEVLKSENVQTGNLDQSLRYIEMPLEVSYSIFNKNKASINLNTGGFVGKLISNHVVLDGNAIGENVDANDYVYGSTLSSTIQYRVYKKTNVFVEPAMNYYINPLNSQSFNQFQWGLNFGLNFSF